MKFQQWISEERRNKPKGYISREAVWNAALRHGVSGQSMMQVLCDIKGLLNSRTPSRDECREIVDAINTVLEENDGNNRKRV